MGVVGFSWLVPFLKWAYAYQAGSRFQKIIDTIIVKVFFATDVIVTYIMIYEAFYPLQKDLNLSIITLKQKKMEINFVVTEKSTTFAPLTKYNVDMEMSVETDYRHTLVTISLQKDLRSLQQSENEIVGKFGFESRTHRSIIVIFRRLGHQLFSWWFFLL